MLKIQNSLIELGRGERTGPALAFLVSLFIYCINLGRPPHPDELHHVLAAQTLFETGLPQILDGEYWRVVHYTWLVALSYELFGDSLASARFPSVLLVSLVSPILLVWVRREAGMIAAWLTVAIFVSSPFAIEIAQFCRFYSLQVLSLVIGLAFLFYATVSTRPFLLRATLLLSSLGMLALAVSAQVTTIVGLVGVSVWLAGWITFKILALPSSRMGVKVAFAVGSLTVAIALVLAGMNSELVAWAWQRHQVAPLFNLQHQNEYWFYYLRYFAFYPTLWTLIGLIAFAAIVRGRSLSWLAICVFASAFLIMSLAGSKNTRYVSFAMPFLAMVWGIGLAVVWPMFRQLIDQLRQRLSDSSQMGARQSELLGGTVTFLAVAVLLGSNPFWLRSVAIVSDVALPFENPVTDWQEAQSVLEPLIEHAQIVVATEELGAIYFLGRADIIFNPSKQRELAIDERVEFGADYRTGLPTIANPESLRQVMTCFQSGIVVGPQQNWGDPVRFNSHAVSVVSELAVPVEVPQSSHLFAWRWQNTQADPKSEICGDLPLVSRLIQG